MKHSILLASLLAAAALTGTAQAQDKPLPPGVHGPAKFAPGGMPPGMPPLKPITRDEALKRAAEQFDAADTNKDGTLTPEEMRAAWEKRQAERPRRPQAEGGAPQAPDTAGGPPMGGMPKR